MKKSKTLVTAALVLGLTGIGTQAQADPTYPEWAGPAPVIFKADKANYNPADGKIYVQVTYRCRNRPGPAGTMHWIKGDIGSLSDGQTRGWAMGLKNAGDGIVDLNCSGRRQTTTLRFWGPEWPPEPQPAPKPGSRATITLTAYQTATPEVGGWYMKTGVEASYKAPITLRVPKKSVK